MIFKVGLLQRSGEAARDAKAREKLEVELLDAKLKVQMMEI